MNQKEMISLLAWLSFTTFCFAAEESITAIKPEDFFGSADNLRILTTAQAITVFRIIALKPPTVTANSLKIDKYTCDGTSSKVGGVEVKELVSALLDRSDGEAIHRSYRWGSIKIGFQKEAYRALRVVAQKAFPNDSEMLSLTP